MHGLTRNRAMKHPNGIYHYLQSMSPQTFRSLMRNLRGLRGQFYREAIGNVRAMPTVATDGTEELPLDHAALSSVSIGPKEPPFIPAVHFILKSSRSLSQTDLSNVALRCAQSDLHEHSAVHWGDSSLLRRSVMPGIVQKIRFQSEISVCWGLGRF